VCSAACGVLIFVESPSGSQSAEKSPKLIMSARFIVKKVMAQQKTTRLATTKVVAPAEMIGGAVAVEAIG